MVFSLRSRLIVLSVATVIMLTASLSLLITSRASEYLKSEVGSRLFATAHQMTERLDQYMWGRRGEMRVLSELSDMKDLQNPEAITDLLTLIKNKFPQFSWIGLTDPQGIVVAATGNILVGQSIAQRPVYQEGIKGEFIGDVHDAVLLAKLLPNPSGEPMKFVDISLPIKVGNETVAVLAAHLSWSWVAQLEESMFDQIRDRDKEEVLIISAIDQTVLLGPKHMLGQRLDLESISRARFSEMGWHQEKWPDGQEYITGYATSNGFLDYPGLGWIVLLRQPASVALKSIDLLNLFVWLTGGAFALAFALLSLRISFAITEPLRMLAQAADRLRFGGKVTIPASRGIAEVDTLTDSLQQLMNSLSEMEAERSKMESFALRDRLTGLFNRRGLEQYLVAPKSKMMILYLDLDGFKQVNDTLGHAAGDAVLKEVAQRLSSSIRDGEIAARLGGDEFIVIVTVREEANKQYGNQIATRIIDKVNEPIAVNGVTATVGCSIGAAFWSGEGSIDDVIETADQALYTAKRSGKNHIVFATV